MLSKFFSVDRPRSLKENFGWISPRSVKRKAWILSEGDEAGVQCFPPEDFQEKNSTEYGGMVGMTMKRRYKAKHAEILNIF